MTGPGGRAEELDCVVVGGGLAGLACAHGLAGAGRAVHVLEAGDAPGGRTRTDWHRGRPVDRGFQVLLGGYRAARRLARAVGIRRRDLRPVSGGAVVLDGERATRLGPSPLALARAGALPAADRARLGRLVAEAAVRSPEDLLAGDDRGGAGLTAEGLLRRRGLSDAAIERVLRPLFGAMLLDRGLAADAGYFRFLLAMLARGPATIPSDGIGMIAEWTTAAIRQRGGVVEVGARAQALEPDAQGRRVVGVRTADGRVLRARQVVLAVPPPAARELLEPLDPASADRLPRDVASAATAAFALRRPLYRGRCVLLDASPAPAGGPRVDLVCQTTNVTRPGAPEGPHVLLATSITTGGASAEGLVEAVGRLVRRWSPRFDWDGLAEPLAVHEHPVAQFRPLPGVRRDLPGPRTAVENLVLAGDATAHPSIEGAVASGARAAGVVDALVP